MLPDHVDLGVVYDRFERDMRHALIYETMADVPLHGLGARRGVSDLSFLHLPIGGISQQVEWVARAHDARAGERQRHPRRVDSDPAPTPLLCDSGRRAGPTSRIEDEIAW